MKKEKTKIKCGKCSYEWNTSSKLINVNCPSCQKKVGNPKHE